MLTGEPSLMSPRSCPRRSELYGPGSSTRKLYVPAASIATIQARTPKEVAGNRGLSLFEPGKASLPGGLVLVPTLVLPGRRVFPVQVVNLSPEGVWLPPKAKLGVLAQGRRVESSSCEVRFHQISADHEEVRVNQRSMTEVSGDLQCPLEKVQIGGTPAQQAELKALLRGYLDVFAITDEDLGYTELVKHEIPLNDDLPVSQSYRRIPPNQFQEVKDHISGLLKKRVIQESSSSYASPVVLVRKTDGSLRLCVDYRKLNCKTRRDAFPLPRIDESLDALSKAKMFSSIDPREWLSPGSSSREGPATKQLSLHHLACMSTSGCRLAYVMRQRHSNVSCRP